ncbi:Uncharacterised protein [Mycobacteroides abscessus subsp. abscessus]|nr:Uncharacterised protein [Mycobacteroides abscessus subsp. abscessus]
MPDAVGHPRLTHSARPLNGDDAIRLQLLENRRDVALTPDEVARLHQQTRLHTRASGARSGASNIEVSLGEQRVVELGDRRTGIDAQLRR